MTDQERGAAEHPIPQPIARPNVQTERPVNPFWARVVLLLAAFIVGLVLYAVLRDPNAPQTALAPGPGAVPLPDSPTSTTTSQRVPLPGDRASGTIAGPDVKTAPPPLKPARPLEDGSAAPSTPGNQPPPGRAPANTQETR
jgi:hypothetical protein